MKRQLKALLDCVQITADWLFEHPQGTEQHERGIDLQQHINAYIDVTSPEDEIVEVHDMTGVPFTLHVVNQKFPQYSFSIKDPKFIPREGEHVVSHYTPPPVVIDVIYDYLQSRVVVTVA